MSATIKSPTPPFQFPPIHSFPPFFTRQINDRTWHSQLINWNALILAYCRYHRLYTLSASSTAMAGNGSSNGPEALTTQESMPTAPGGGPPDERQVEIELFSNETIKRSLKPETISSIFEYMVQSGSAMWLDSPNETTSNSKKSQKKKASGFNSDEEEEEDDDEDGYEKQFARFEALQSQQRPSASSSSRPAQSTSVVVYWRRPQEWATLISEWVDSTGQNGSVLTLYELVQSDAVRNQEFRELHPAVLKQALDVMVARNKAVVMRDGNGMVAGIKVI